MSKKKYLSPTMKVVEVKAQQIICASPVLGCSSQNESYDTVDESVTDSWFK